MTLAQADGSLETELAHGGTGVFKKFLGASSDIYSFAMHKKVAQQGDDAFRAFQVSRGGEDDSG